MYAVRAGRAERATQPILGATRVLLSVRGLAIRVREGQTRAAGVRVRTAVVPGEERTVDLAQLDRAVGAAALVARKGGVRGASEREGEDGEGGGEGANLHGW